jgi:anthranilate synthase component 1
MYCPDERTFASLAGQGTLIPVYREIMADLDTPVSAFRKIDDGRCAFLLESIEGGEKWGRYTFLGASPATIIRSRGTTVEVLETGKEPRVFTAADPLAALREELARYTPVELLGLPRFFGGAVGYLGYDMVRFFEHLPSDAPAHIGAWDSFFLITDSLIIFDNVSQKIKVVANAHLDGGVTAEEAYQQAIRTIDALIAKLKVPTLPHVHAPVSGSANFTANMERAGFEAAVERAKEYVRAGDIIQVVLSQRFSGDLTVDPFDIYRVLRTLNPSPYLFFLRLEETVVLGASPEVMVRKEGSRVELRPIAGTRPRGMTAEEDGRLADDLLADPKERAEHVMLVDLGRNDLGRVCNVGTVEVTELMVIERYSHVMHIVSNVRGELAPEQDAFSLVRATFPAGTLSGAPKIRAMQIIDELEPCRREVYGGAVGYFSFSGNMDLAIAIRTLVVKDGRIHLQAGAGIVADSDPAAEWQETVNKAMAVKRAVEMAEAGID